MTQPTTNSAWTIPASASSVSQLTKTTLPVPIPGSNQVLIRLLAASLNYRDILVATNSPDYPGPHKPSLVPCSDGFGVIHSTGPKSKWAGREGTRVLLHPNTWLKGDVRGFRFDQNFGGMGTDGTLVEWKVDDDEKVIEVKGGLSAGEGASLVTAGVPAWSAIRELLDAKYNGEVGEWKGKWTEKRLRGKTVLTMGTGGVSCFAIQIASALGATVIATSSSDSKLELAKSLGATHLINYKQTPDWDKEVLRLTEGKGVDQVIEVGGVQTLLRSVNSTRIGGLISLIGNLGDSEQLSKELASSILYGAKIVKGCLAFSRDMHVELVRFVEANGIKPLIAKTYEFDQAVEAFEVLQKQNATGKIVVKIGAA